MALDYENIILISHEDTSKDITKKGGDKLTSIKPNLAEKVATKVAGMVDIVARVVADGDVRLLSFKSNEVIFGGGRLTTKTNEIALDYDEFLEVYEEANKAAVESMKNGSNSSTTSGSRTSRERKSSTEEKPTENENQAVQGDTEPEEETVTEPTTNTEAPVVDAEPVVEAPRTRVRKRRSEN